MVDSENLVSFTADIVSAYVTRNTVAAADLPSLIAGIHRALATLSTESQPEAPALTPAVSIRKSVTPDYIVCLEDGKKFKALKRHLGVHYNLTPEEYRQKWGLPADYPMVAPAYAATRSALAKEMGLGRKPKVPEPAPKKRGRRKAAVAE